MESNLLILTFDGNRAREIRKRQKKHFEESLDESVYSCPACIILGHTEHSRFDRKRFHKEIAFNLEDIKKTPFGYVIPGDFSSIQEELGLERIPAGIFFSKRKPKIKEAFTFTISSFSLALLKRQDGGYLLLQ